MTPLSHHEILRLVAPFARADRHVDLAQSDRGARLLTFKPVVHPAASRAQASGQLTETLRLDLSRRTSSLRRTVTTDDGLQAILDASGADLGALLERVLAVSPETQFRAAGGLVVADSYVCPEDPEQPLELRASRARVRGLEIALDAEAAPGAPMRVTLTPEDPRVERVLPADLVAVLGMPWKLLREDEGRWQFLLYAPSREPRRSMVTKERFARAVAHLDSVLGAAPAAFHSTHAAARWRVWLRRLMPLAICVTIVASLPLFDSVLLKDGLRMNPLILGISNFMILAFMYVSRHEIPKLETPPFPRSLASDAWPSAAVEDSARVAETVAGRRARG